MFESQEWTQQKISEIGIIPVIKLEDTKDAIPLAKALLLADLPAAEITFRANGAEQVIKAMKESVPDLLAGAGTVLTVRQVRTAVEAGAQFIVSPGYDEEVVSYCVSNEIPVFPGCVTPTEIQKALKHGLNVIKFFPASQYGGLDTIKALGGPFPDIRFMPTGGISLNNLDEYMADQRIAACGGSFMVKDSLIREKNWSEITRISREAVRKVKEARRERHG